MSLPYSMQYMLPQPKPVATRREENYDRTPAHESASRSVDHSMTSKHPFSSAEKQKERTRYESTADGNVVIVEQSFDAKESNSHGYVDPAADTPPGSNHHTPIKPVHRRDLSAHFFDATRLTDDSEVSKLNDKREYPMQHSRPQKPSSFAATRSSPRPHDGGAAAFSMAANQPISPAMNVGNKHRRGYSGGFSNPAVAHRRINSIGDSQQVDRYGYYGGYYPPAHRPYSHRREDSAGLNILSAVADESEEQLEMAVGPKRISISQRVPWEHQSKSSGERRMDPPQPVNTSSSYDFQPHYSTQYAYSGPQSGYYPHQQQDSFYPPGPTPPGFHQPQRNSAYPVQYAPLKDRSMPSNKQVKRERLGTEEKLFQRKKDAWGNGTTTGVQTYVTAISVGDGNRTIIPAPSQRITGTNTEGENAPIPSSAGHHRKLSSYSSLGTIMGSGLFADPEQPAGHHRSTSSSVSLLQGLDGDIFFMQNVAAPAPPRAYSPSTYASSRPAETTSQSMNVVSSSEVSGRALAQGGTSKRIRRKCTIAGCANRVVQGGLCISHGAKRKTCKHPGCPKNVKKAGLCSTHGPARKRCEHGSCNKVAVQGGRCIAHGAKKKLCCHDDCSKQAILNGMCKKHHDASNGILPTQEGDPGVTINVPDLKSGKAGQRPSHTRGLSIFQEMSAESVQTLLSAEASEGHPLKGDDTHPLKKN